MAGKGTRYKEEQIIRILKEVENGAKPDYHPRRRAYPCAAPMSSAQPQVRKAVPKPG